MDHKAFSDSNEQDSSTSMFLTPPNSVPPSYNKKKDTVSQYHDFDSSLEDPSRVLFPEFSPYARVRGVPVRKTRPVLPPLQIPPLVPSQSIYTPSSSPNTLKLECGYQLETRAQESVRLASGNKDTLTKPEVLLLENHRSEQIFSFSPTTVSQASLHVSEVHVMPSMSGERPCDSQ